MCTILYRNFVRDYVITYEIPLVRAPLNSLVAAILFTRENFCARKFRRITGITSATFEFFVEFFVDFGSMFSSVYSELEEFSN